MNKEKQRVKVNTWRIHLQTQLIMLSVLIIEFGYLNSWSICCIIIQLLNSPRWVVEKIQRNSIFKEFSSIFSTCLPLSHFTQSLLQPTSLWAGLLLEKQNRTVTTFFKSVPFYFMQITTTMKYNFTPIWLIKMKKTLKILISGEDVEEWKHPYTSGENIYW